MHAPARGVLKAFSFGPPSARFGAQVSSPPFVRWLPSPRDRGAMNRIVLGGRISGTDHGS
jgi:hypothetical protein